VVLALLERELQHEIVEHLISSRSRNLRANRRARQRRSRQRTSELLPRSIRRGSPISNSNLILSNDDCNHAFFSCCSGFLTPYRESRRANSQLRSTKLTDPLQTIFRPDGTISEFFPRDVSSHLDTLEL